MKSIKKLQSMVLVKSSVSSWHRTGKWAAQCALFASCSIFASTHATAQSTAFICSLDNDVRRFEVVTPGVVGKACDLKVIRDGGANVSTPYHANNQQGYCADKANELVSALKVTGFACVDGGVVVAGNASSAEVAPVSAANVDRQARDVLAAEAERQGAVQTGVSAPTSSELAPASVATRVVPQEIIPASNASETGVNGTAPIAPALNIADAPPAEQFEDAREKIVNGVTRSQTADGAPIQLADASANQVSAPSRVAARSSSATGRLTGATPVDVELSQPPAPAESSPIRVSAIEETPAAESQALGAVDASLTSRNLRSTPELIKNVLAAQAAAWNEGDLAAFMEGYLKDSSLRMVSTSEAGTTVTTGWKKVMRRYADRYGDSGDLGVLSFKKLSVEMIEDDVATVFGRFNLEKEENVSTGAFTLVMRRAEGVWRIVHDHSASDPQVEESETEE